MRIRILAAIALALLRNSLAVAAPSAAVEVANFSELDKGTANGTLISSEGEVVVGWDAAPVPDGEKPARVEPHIHV